MVVFKVPVNGCNPVTIVLGRRGTYNTQEVTFDLSYLVENYGAGTAALMVKRSQDTSAYPAVASQEDNILTWIVSDLDTYYPGSGECQLMWYVDEGLAKTIIYPMVVMKDILQTTEEPPDGYENWIEHLTGLGAKTQQNAQNAAQSASEAKQAKDDAVDAKEASEEAARKAAEVSVHAPIIQNGFWYIWSGDQYVNTNVRAEGEKGDKGDKGEKGDTGNGVASITKTGTSGLVDKYTVTYTDGTSTTFTVTNGAKGDKGDTGATGNGIQSIMKTGTSGNVDTYTITYTNGQTTTFTVTNGAVTSVAGKTGAVVLDAGDIGYDATETYQSGAIGEAVSDLTRQISDVESVISDITIKTGNPLTFVDSARHEAIATAENATLIAVYGTQLFNANAWQNKTGVSSVADGVITFNGTNATGSADNIVSTPYLPKGKYTVKIEAMDSDTKYCRFALRKSDNTTLADTNAYLLLPYVITMNPGQDVYKMSAIAKHESADTVNIGAIRITINSGESVGNYEDYIGAVYDVSDTIYTVPGNNFIVADTVNDITLSYFQLISSKYLMERIDSNTEAISELNDNTIVKRNNDVATKVDACSSYGLKTAAGVLRHTLSILCMTDIHSYDFDEIQNAVAYLNDNDSIDIGVCLGDMAPSKYTDPATDFVRYVGESDKPYYTILGNHDTGNNTSLTDSTTIANAFAKWVKDTTSIENLSLPYYKVDTDYGITLIFLNNYDVPDTVSEGAYTVSRGAEVVSQTQIDWLLNTLDNVPSDNTVIVLRHSFPDANTRVDCNFSMKSRNLQGNGVACYTDIVPDIINAWKNGTALNKTYSPNVSGVTASVAIDHNFATRGSGKFACYIVGHVHRDVVAKSTTYPDQIAVGFESTSYAFYQNGLADLPRVMGQKSQDALTVVSIDPTAKLVKMVRVGSNCTVDMVDRTMIAIDY